MNIIILGAGRVGSTVASNLAHESNNLTLVDTNPEVLAEISEHLDIATVCGNAAHPETLIRAGINKADMLIAVTDSDETNMMACQVTNCLFETPQKLARVRAEDYLKYRDTLFSSNAIPIDVIINPEEEITAFIRDLILHPGSQQVLSFANGAISLVEMKADANGPIQGLTIRELGNKIPDISARVAAIYRDKQILIPKFDTAIEPLDRVFFIAPSEDIQTVLTTLLELEKPYKRLIIAGGGRIGLGLARALENQMQVKIIVKNPERARWLTEQLHHSIILTGDASDENLLMEENIDRTDVFCCVTNDDEVNILCSMLAKRLGARTVMSLVDRNAYMSMVETGSIDNAIYPQHTTIGCLLAYVRRGHISRVHSLLRGKAEAFEAIVTGDEGTSKLTGKTIQQIKLPRGAYIIGVARDNQSIQARGELVVQEHDHLIVLVTDKSTIPAIESLFQASAPLLKRLAR